MFFTATRKNNTWTFDGDNGWTQFGSIWAKGYANDRPLQKVVQEYDFTKPSKVTGNFALIRIDNKGIAVGHSRDRSFPLWASSTTVSNLNCVGESIWADTLICVDSQGQIQRSKIDIAGVPEQTLTMDQVTDRIVDLVVKQSTQFLQHTRLPVTLFRSGGLDTAFLYALIKKLQTDYVEIKDSIFEVNNFITNNTDALNKFWAYKQLHHWNSPCVIATGSQGDEYFLRGPSAVAMIMAWHDIDFVKILRQNPDAYHSWYFLQPKNLKIFEYHYNNRHYLCEQFPTRTHLNNQIVNMLANDHQHWHLGQTLTWTPQKDLDIARLALCLPIDDLISNGLHGTLTKNCIGRLFPDALLGVTKHKNRKVSAH